MTEAATLHRTAAAPIAAASPKYPPWRPMESAPQTRIILCKTNFRDTVVVVSCHYVPEHGGYCLLPLSNSGHNYAPVWPTGWMECPPITHNIRE